MNINELQTKEAQKVAKVCEGITAEDFLNKFYHHLMVGMRMARLGSERDMNNPACPVRRRAKEDFETWGVYADTIERLGDPKRYAAIQRSNLEYAATRYCDAN